MSEISGYAIETAKYRVQQECLKPLLGKPFVKYGQCLVMAGYFFQMGGILGDKYRDKLDDFGWAFLGLRGEAGAMGRFYGEVAKDMLPHVTECFTVFDCAIRTQPKELDFKGDVSELLLQYGMQKVKPEIAVCWNYYAAEEGSVLGALHPDHFKRLFENTNKERDEKSWQFAHACGLDIPEKQDVLTYDEAQQGEVESFLCYCQQWTPSLYVSLSSA